MRNILSNHISRHLLSLLFTLFFFPSFALDKQHLQDTLNHYAGRQAAVGEIKVSQIKIRSGKVDIYTNSTLAALQLTDEVVNDIYSIVRKEVGTKGKIYVHSDGYEISELITHVHYRGDGKNESRSKRKHLQRAEVQPLTTNISRPWLAEKGLEGRHIALYGSHGLYFNQGQERWSWQRARVLTTVEDLYTSSYTMPFLVPMLENAGAVVIQPRERDRQTNEIIVDEKEAEGIEAWITTDHNGWGPSPDGLLFEGENPFTFGGYATYCKSQDETNVSSSDLIYRPQLPASGEYAVYVSYKTIAGSTKNATYSVWHAGEETLFRVNQQMGGSTWIYLGTFFFTTNPKDNYVRLISGEHSSNNILTSDAVRFGGGMGSVARYSSKNVLNSNTSARIKTLYNAKHKKREERFIPPHRGEVEDIVLTSGLPRWIEGSRYYLQYSGIPDSVYNYSGSFNDYTDDYTSRGRWANYLTGGSSVYPEGQGLNIPLDLFIAIHSDAGTTLDDSIIGTLVIYTDHDDDNKQTYPAGANRILARDYADYVQTQIVEDIRATIAPQWNRRRLLNSSYSESRNPKMPAILVELLSHQNFADMRYGLDPAFRFIVSRAIYKGMLRFLHEQYGTSYIVQPLPVKNFSIALNNKSEAQLTWQPRLDSLEVTAKPDRYIVYKRIAGKDWDNGTVVKDTFATIPLLSDTQYDFRICALNKGGQSFPSETLTAYHSSKGAGKVLIVNAFTRICAPQSFQSNDTLYAGFAPEHYGIGYMNEISYIGEQYEFLRSKQWENDDQCGFGASYNNYRAISPRGNTFDYPTQHGKTLADLGYSFCSTSVGAISEQTFCDSTITLVDIICGKDSNPYPNNLRQSLQHYKGSLLISGSYLGSTMQSDFDKKWTSSNLHYAFRAERASHSGEVDIFRNIGGGDTQIVVSPSEDITCAEAPDGIMPIGKNAIVVARYKDTGIAAAVAFENKYLIFGFPLESTTNFNEIYTTAVNYLTSTNPK